MRATTAVSSLWRAYALAFGLGLAIAALGAGLAHAQSSEPSSPTQIASAQITQGLLPPLPHNSFICHAKPAGRCDLSEGRGFGGASVN